MEIGYRMLRRFWGNGYATEAAEALADLALSDPKTTRLVAVALVANQASTRVMEKIGMKPEAEFALPGYTEPAVKYAR